MNKFLLISTLGFFSAPAAMAQNVGIGLNTPVTKLHVNQTANVTGIRADMLGTAGNGLLINQAIAGNPSSAVFIPNASSGVGINLNMTNAASVAPGIQITQAGIGIGQVIAHNNDGAGQLIDMTSATNAISGQQINHIGTGNGSWVIHSGAGNGYRVNHTGTGVGLLVDHQGAGLGSVNIMDLNAISHVNDLLANGGTGSITLMDGNDGDGYVFSNVDNALAPTTGGDGFGFDAVVNTQTTTAGVVNGGVIAGTQWGVGHGMLLTHEGTAGRGAEVNMLNANNTEPNFFGINQGEGSVIVGQNQNNTIVGGPITVAEFAYVGTDADNHIGVFGQSAPAAGLGFGVVGVGNFFGTFSLGNSGASGLKSFLIDHPADPENKMLKHFSVESNEVLNMYRGMVELDASGQAVVVLPDYFELINKDFSYQLTAIGTPQQPYILEEINGNEFKVAGAPNTKVSWTVYADRNDPYLQQNPNQADDVVTKSGSSQGKYITPELYGQPASAGMFYSPNLDNGGASTSTAPVPASMSQYQKPTNAGQEQEVPNVVEEPEID